MRGRMSENDAKVVRDVVSIVAENESLRAELAATKEAAFRAGWIAGQEACGETEINPDTDPTYQVARQRQEDSSDG